MLLEAQEQKKTAFLMTRKKSDKYSKHEKKSGSVRVNLIVVKAIYDACLHTFSLRFLVLWMYNERVEEIK